MPSPPPPPVNEPSANPAFEQLVRDHQDTVFRTLVRLTGSTDRAEDLAQEVFLRLYRALPNFRGQSLISTYLYRITVNVAQDEWKRRRREDRPLVSLTAPTHPQPETASWEERLAHPDPNAEQLLEHREFAALIDRELARLSNIERAILVLYHQEERSYQQIAAALNLPIGTVRTHLHRGRTKMREAIAARQAQNRSTACLAR